MGWSDRLPPGAALLVSLQQVAAMVVGVITPALLLANILKFAPADTAYLVSMALLAAALGTFLQTTRIGPVGSGLLSVTGTSFAFIQPLMQAGQAGGLPLMFGMSLATAPVSLALAPFLPKLRRFFSPLVCGIVVLLIGLSIIPEAMYGIVAAPVPGAPAWAGAAIAACVIAAVVAAQAVGQPWTRLAGILFGVGAGYAVCTLCGWLQAPAPNRSGWIAWPRLLPHGLAFRGEFVLPFAFIYVVSVIESLGDMTATAQLSGLETRGRAHGLRMRAGIFADGITSIVSALIGSFPSTTYAQNNGVIQITGVASRHVGRWMAAILALLGLLPPVARWVTAMPPAVLGGLALLLFGLVSVAGLRLISQAGLNHRNALVVALALGVGIGAPSRPQWLETLPPDVAHAARIGNLRRRRGGADVESPLAGQPGISGGLRLGLERSSPEQACRQPIVLFEDDRQVDGGDPALFGDDTAIDHSPGRPRRRAKHQRGHRIMPGAGKRHVIEVERRKVGGLAGGERADVVPIEDPGSTEGAEFQGAAGGHGARAKGDPLQQQGLADLPEQVRSIIGSRPVDAETDGNPSRAQPGDRGDSGTEAHVGARAVRHARAGAGENVDPGLIELHAVGTCQTSGPSQARSSAYSAGVRPNFSRL